RSPTRRSSARSSSGRRASPPATTLDSPVTGGAIVEVMQIGRFSRLTGLTVKALRHYDEIGLLRPAAVDPETGYRTYTSEQVERAELIRTLRTLELPLDEITELLASGDPAQQKRVLVGHQRRSAARQVELKWIL